MPTSKVSKFFRSLLPRSASPCVYDAGLGETDDPYDYVDECYFNADVGDAAGIVRAEQLSDGTLLLRARTPSLGSGGIAAQPSINLSEVSFYTHGVHATLTPSRSLQPSRSLLPHAPSLPRDRSVVDSERNAPSSATLSSAELPALFHRTSSVRGRLPP